MRARRPRSPPTRPTSPTAPTPSSASTTCATTWSRARDARVQRGPPFRHRRRGRLHPHRRGPHAAHHLRRWHAAPPTRTRSSPASCPALKRGEDFEMDEAKKTINATESRPCTRSRSMLGIDEHLRRPVRPAGQSPAAGAEGAVPVPSRRRLRGRGRRGEDRRRVHRPHHGGPPLLRGPASGARGQRARAGARGEPDAGHHHAAELLPPLRQALGHDRYGHDRGRRVPPDLQAAGRGYPAEQAGDPHRRGRSDLSHRRCEVQRRGRRRRRAPCRRASPA